MAKRFVDSLGGWLTFSLRDLVLLPPLLTALAVTFYAALDYLYVTRRFAELWLHMTTTIVVGP